MHKLFTVLCNVTHHTDAVRVWSKEEADAVAKSFKESKRLASVEIHQIGEYPDVVATVSLLPVSLEKAKDLPFLLSVENGIATLQYHPKHHRDVADQIHNLNLSPFTRYSYFPPE